MIVKKAELHVHLEGTITPEMGRILAKKNRIALPESIISEDQQSYHYQDFLDFLKVYDLVADVICTPEDYYTVTFDYLRRSAQAGVIYVEMMYSPDHAEMVTNIPSREHLAAIQQAIDDAQVQYGIMGTIIVTAVRHFGVEAALRVAQGALQDHMPCVVGFGLGGNEVDFPPHLFARAYDIAHSGGLQCTVHAGEHVDASGIIEALDYLPVRRIGHGVMAYQSPETIARLKDQNIALELCPSSNVALGLFSSFATHPFPALRDAGITVSLNSDDPPFFNTTVEREYELAETIWGFTPARLTEITQMAITASFASDTMKKCLLERLVSG